MDLNLRLALNVISIPLSTVKFHIFTIVLIIDFQTKVNLSNFYTGAKSGKVVYLETKTITFNFLQFSFRFSLI